MKWTDNYTLEGAGDDMALRGQYQFAMYAIHLSCGNTIFCKRIKAATIEQYLLAVASFIALFTGRDYRKDQPNDRQFGHVLAPILKDLKRYETVPNRREPYEPAMHICARELGQRLSSNCLYSALIDAAECGYCAAYRLSEFIQPAGRKDPLHPLQNHMVTSMVRTRAIVPDDLRALTKSRRKASGLDILKFPLEDVERMWIKFRTQKNNQHGEEKMFVRNTTPTGFCYVSSSYRSLLRFRRLQAFHPGLVPTVTPLSVYLDTQTTTVRLIDGKDMEGFIRHLAAKVYHLHPARDAEDISKWGVHSLRVGTCVTLHAMGFSPLDIQWIGRWRSTAFMVYLRNVAFLSTRQNQAYDRASALPFV